MSCLRMSILAMAFAAAACGQAPHDRDAELRTQRRMAAPTAAAYLVRAQDALHARAYADALALADSAESFGPTLADVAFLRGRVYSEMALLDEAAAAYLRAVERVDDYRGARLNLGNVAQRQKRYERALEYYLEEIDRFPAASVHVEAGRAYAALGDVKRARDHFDEAIALDEGHAPAYMRAAELLADAGQAEVALRYAKRGLNIQPKNPHYRYMVGYIEHQGGLHAEAVTTLRQVVEELPTHRGAHYNLGLALRQRGLDEEASHFLEKAQQLQIEEGRINELRAEAELDPRDVDRWAALARTLFEADRLEDASNALEIARALAPGDAAIATNLATIDLARGDTKKAISRYRRILEHQPRARDLWLNLGVAYARNGQPDSARAAWRRAQALGSVEASQYLAQLHDASLQ